MGYHNVAAAKVYINLTVTEVMVGTNNSTKTGNVK
jgi:hypothetical protein